MPKKRLTEEGVAKLKPPLKGQIDYFDAGMPGLVLRVNYGGAKIWRALYYLKKNTKDGKRLTVPTTYKLGRYPHLKLKEARDAARVFLANPQAALAKTETGSFKQIAENFIKRHVEANKLRSQPEIERCLKRYLYPKWENRRFLELKRADVAQLMDEIEDENGPRQADVVLAILSKLMNWFASRDNDYVSPIVRGMRRTNAAERKRKRILTDDEIRAVWRLAPAVHPTFGALLKSLLLTAQRREKVATAKWDDFSEAPRLNNNSATDWKIFNEPREKSNAGLLRLPQLALQIIEGQPRIAANPYVFASERSAAFNSFSQRKAELDVELKKIMPNIEAWTLHDLRRTARSLMSRAGVRSEIAERVLGHAIPGVEGVYDRHAYYEEKAEALSRLADLVTSIITTAGGINVVPQPAAVKRYEAIA